MEWSKSKLGTMRQCPLKFKFTYIDMLPQPEPHEDLLKGSILHGVFDKFYDNLKETRPLFGAMYETLKQKDIKQKFIDKYSNHISNFIIFNQLMKQQYGEQFIPHQRETHYKFENIHGIIDRVDYIDGKYILIDYKTSFGDSIDTYEDELIFYAYLFQENTGKEINKIGVFFSGNGRLITKEIDQEYIKITMESIMKEIQFYNKIMIETEKLQPKESFACKWCPYHKECPSKQKK